MDDFADLDLSEWRDRGFAPPAPHRVKLEAIKRHYIPGSIWIETGTYLAETTSEMALLAPRVFTIEPKRDFVHSARERLSGHPHVTVLEGLSENVLPQLLAHCESESVTMWLDGHWSSGNTFSGPLPTPIVQELEAIAAQSSRFKELSVAVDDLRCFYQKELGFPGVNYLCEWAEALDLAWIIEHDIFFAKSRTLPWIPGAR